MSDRPLWAAPLQAFGQGLQQLQNEAQQHLRNFAQQADQARTTFNRNAMHHLQSLLQQQPNLPELAVSF